MDYETTYAVETPPEFTGSSEIPSLLTVANSTQRPKVFFGEGFIIVSQQRRPVEVGEVGMEQWIARMVSLIEDELDCAGARIIRILGKFPCKSNARQYLSRLPCVSLHARELGALADLRTPPPLGYSRMMLRRAVVSD